MLWHDVKNMLQAAAVKGQYWSIRVINADRPTELAACSAVQEAFLLSGAHDHTEVQLCAECMLLAGAGPKQT